MKKVVTKLIILAILINSFYSLISTNEVQAASYNQVIINANSNNNNGINAFPASYQKELKKLVEATGHSNWKFKPFYTDIDWAELTSENNENKCFRNTIYKTNTSWFCSCGRQGDIGYYCASNGIVNYYLDPRNFLTETTIFQFLDLSNSTKVSVNDIAKAVKGTYLDGSVNGKTYAQMIYSASEASGESALSIVVKIFQELGRGKTLPAMINGKNEKYPSTYNFFNFGATDGVGNTERGLEYAKNAGWTTPEKALIEGAKLIANSYIKVGQNTKYTFKFDVVSDSQTGLYWHQYMTNVQDPNNQAKMLYDEYLNNGWLSQDLTFIIPVYKNMPSYVKLPSDFTTSSGKLYYISPNYTDVSFRTDKSSSADLIQYLKKDTVVLMKQYNVDNSDWSKVSVNGREGYVTNRYLTEVNLAKDSYSVPSQPSTATNNASNNSGTNSSAKTNSVNVTNTNGKTNTANTTNTTVSNTTKNNVVSNTTTKTNTVGGNTTNSTGNNTSNITRKKGDVNFDGKITASDYVLIKNHIMGISNLSSEQQKYADFNEDNKITASDYVLIKNEIMK